VCSSDLGPEQVADRVVTLAQQALHIVIVRVLAGQLLSQGQSALQCLERLLLIALGPKYRA